LNIELITYANIESISGEAGNFSVRIRKQPRFVNLSKCTGCGECTKVCPVKLSDDYNEGLVDRRAIYKRYAQAIPGAYAIEKRGTAPCKIACPAHVSVQGFIALINEGKYQEALQLFKEEHPFPGVCGRVCHHPCEGACTRNEADQPLGIMYLHRFLSDKDLESGKPYLPEIKDRKSEKIGIIGAGPAGLTCAYFLAIEGYQVTVFEKLPVLGGMLTVGIPSYRLPRNIIESEIQVIKDLGVQFKTGVEIGKDITVAQLRKEGYKAFFMGIGAHECKVLGIEGEDLKGVYPGVEFLREVNLGKSVPLGERVAVVGGGNVAMDSVRTALRNGSSKAFVIYRRSYDEMPANKEEIEECSEEGIEIMTLTNPVRIIGENGKVKAVECVKMELGEPDKSGRRRPRAISGSEFLIEVDSVIPAIGQESDWACLTDECACTLSDWGTLTVDPATLQSNDPDIFAGGDAVSGPATVVEAIAAGKEAAISIDRFVRGADLSEGRQKIYNAVNPAEVLEGAAVSKEERMKMPHLLPGDRVNNFNEVQLGFDEDRVKKEAQRCLSCGICSECYQCVKTCMAVAIDHSMTAEVIEVNAGSIILTPGFEPFDPSEFDSYNYAGHPNVISAMEFERILSASGPTMGHLARISDHKEPKKIAWFQCVGSRDINRCDNSYCSSVCCMYAIKEAVIAKEHAGSDLDCTIFFMDMRTYGKDFERYYENAKKQGVRFIRSRVHTIDPIPGTGDLSVRYITESGEILNETFDMIVLSVGMQTSKKVKELAEKLGVEMTEGNFCKTDSVTPVQTSKPGIFVAGAFQGPKDIPQSVVDASAAAAAAGEILASARNTLTKTKEIIPEVNVTNERPRIGVFVCRCGINIAGVVDVPDVRDYAATLPFVDYVSDNMYTCSQDTQEIMTQIIKANNLNRIIVAACTPKTHEPLFQETLVAAGLNKYLFEMVNIRNHDSWVHKNNPDIATQKAKDLVRMAVQKVALKEPLKETELNVHQNALVIGGGISGMASALTLARQGFETHLVERDAVLGGQARNLHKTWIGEDIQKLLGEMVNDVEKEKNIHVHLNTRLKTVEGFVGNFKTSLLSEGSEQSVEHGVAVIATGASEYEPKEYLYGKDSRVVTALELDRMFNTNDSSLKNVRTAVFIQCVGSREPDRPYCSRVCCTHSIQNALELKRRNPDTDVYILYRDIRTYGEREYIYKDARKAGVIFIRYSLDNKPKVLSQNGQLSVIARDHVLGRPLEIETDLVTLASAIVPYKDEQLAQYFKVAMNADGFFVERHAKLGPSEFATDGVFLCGLAHYPKSIDESVAQGKAAASRAITLLARKKIFTSGEVASVNPMVCSSCGVCVSICPYSAPSFIAADARFFAGKAQINPALCKGCGLCVASCRSGAIGLKGFDNNQIFAMLEAV